VAVFQASATVLVVFATRRRFAGAPGGVSGEPSQLALSTRHCAGVAAVLSRKVGLYG
jgi:hypothetical protein